jgi:hypothetical protein
MGGVGSGVEMGIPVGMRGSVRMGVQAWEEISWVVSVGGVKNGQVPQRGRP